jgi:hypothetical protein
MAATLLQPHNSSSSSFDRGQEAHSSLQSAATGSLPGTLQMHGASSGAALTAAAAGGSVVAGSSSAGGSAAAVSQQQ